MRRAVERKNRPMKQKLKERLFRLLRKDPEAVVVSFCSGPPSLCERMVEEVRSLVPDRRHFVATEQNWPELRKELKRYRIGLAPVMLAGETSALRRAAYRLAPRKILAYNTRLERYHLRSDLASLLFWRGVPLDRICPAAVVVALVRNASARSFRVDTRFWKAARAYRAGAWLCSRPTCRTRSRTAARCGFSTCCARSRVEFDIELFAFQHEDDGTIGPGVWSSALASCW